jgi:hypothetical protein
VCPKKHVGQTFESITIDGYKERRACNTCGGVAKPATIRRVAEAAWGNRSTPKPFYLNPPPDWGWYNHYDGYFGLSLGWGKPLWTSYKFVHFLDTPKPRRKK